MPRNAPSSIPAAVAAVKQLQQRGEVAISTTVAAILNKTAPYAGVVLEKARKEKLLQIVAWATRGTHTVPVYGEWTNGTEPVKPAPLTRAEKNARSLQRSKEARQKCSREKKARQALGEAYQSLQGPASCNILYDRYVLAPLRRT